MELRRGTSGTDPLLSENQFEYVMATAGAVSDSMFAFLMGKDVSAPLNAVYAVHAGTDGTLLNANVQFLVLNGIAESSFTDGGVTDTSGGTEVTLVTSPTGLSAGDNIIIGMIKFGQHCNGNQFQANANTIKLDKGTTTLADNEFITITNQKNRGGQSHFALLVARDAGASADATYNLKITDAIGNAGTSAEGKIIVIGGSGLTSDSIDGTSTAIGVGRTIMATKITTFLQGDDVIIGSFQLEAPSVANTIPIAGADIQEASESTDTSNLFAFPENIAAQRDSAKFLGFARKVTTSSPNPVYEAGLLATATGMNGEAKLIAIHIHDTRPTRTLTET